LTQGQKKQFWANFDILCLLYPAPFIDVGKIWYARADPRFTLTCQILSWSVYSVALWCRKIPIFAIFWTSAFWGPPVGGNLGKL